MSKSPLVLLIAAFLPAACTQAPGGPPPQRALASATAAPGEGGAIPTVENPGRGGRGGPPAPEGALAGPTAAPGEGGSIESVEYHGTGCDGGSAATGVSPDQQAVTSTFSDFLASTGDGTSPDDASRNCLLMVKINVPQGWS